VTGTLGTKEGKVYFVHVMKAYGEVEVWLPQFLNFTLVGGRW